MLRQCRWGMTNSIQLNTMVTLINLDLVYFYIKRQFETKIHIKIPFIIICIYVSLAKSFANCVIGKNIVILDPLEAQEIKMIPLSTHIWCASNRFCGVYENVDFCNQNPCLNEYGCIIPFAMSNDGWFESVYMSLLMNNDISTYFLYQKFSYFLFSTFWFHTFSEKQTKFIQIRSGIIGL